MQAAVPIHFKPGVTALNVPVNGASPSWNLTLRYLHKSTGGRHGPFTALQTLSLSKTEEAARAYAPSAWEIYDQQAKSRLEYFARLFDRSYDAVLIPPGRYTHLITPYQLAVPAAKWDLTSAFRKIADVSSGGGVSYDKLMGAVAFDRTAITASMIKSLLIVDKLFATGKTAAVVLVHLFAAGLLSEDATVEVATPLWIADSAIKHGLTT